MPLNTLQLSLQFGDLADAALHRIALPRHKVARWIRHALAADAEITVRIVGLEEGRALNRDYRNKDYATNVLTFDYTREPLVTADLVLCAPVVEQEAREQGKTLQAHYAHLLVHGTLHAQGWDHETSRADAEEMEAYEIQSRPCPSCRPCASSSSSGRRPSSSSSCPASARTP
jgi:probable rRNA maturation factor